MRTDRSMTLGRVRCCADMAIDRLAFTSSLRSRGQHSQSQPSSSVKTAPERAACRTVLGQASLLTGDASKRPAYFLIRLFSTAKLSSHDPNKAECDELTLKYPLAQTLSFYPTTDFRGNADIRNRGFESHEVGETTVIGDEQMIHHFIK